MVARFLIDRLEKRGTEHDHLQGVVFQLYALFSKRIARVESPLKIFRNRHASSVAVHPAHTELYLCDHHRAAVFVRYVLRDGKRRMIAFDRLVIKKICAAGIERRKFGHRLCMRQNMRLVDLRERCGALNRIRKISFGVERRIDCALFAQKSFQHIQLRRFFKTLISVRFKLSASFGDLFKFFFFHTSPRLSICQICAYFRQIFTSVYYYNRFSPQNATFGRRIAFKILVKTKIGNF